MDTYHGLEKLGKKWISELPCALWGNRTSPNWATGETPFLVYGAEPVLPTPPSRSPWAPSVSRHTMKPHRTSSSVVTLSSSMSEDGNLLVKCTIPLGVMVLLLAVCV
jgi:hypothetical protein